ncbi:methylaspartate mutase [Kribbella solani]|uniref:Methylaspartate mutase epsilon subunit n=1 Tax=Kribbella solani TaxID=236067 RepID=A0A841DGD3_9ACTN|nr:methylaspartate mutase epsilon subunit [Kribbella solani]
MSRPGTGALGEFVARAQQAGRLVVQPRMGVSDAAEMRAGLQLTKAAAATTVGTITLDSYTRVGDHDSASAALAAGIDLNGYPIVAHDVATTRGVLDGVAGPGFPVQVRHGSPLPAAIISSLTAAGLHATEGGPVSYCLPYSRVPLSESIPNWALSCELLTQIRETGVEPHLETFGGCTMGQLCPPGLLVALSVLECMFFRQHGLRSVSLSYAQQTDPDQDAEAILAMRRLAAQWLPDVEWHVVVYTYMGVYPRTPEGATRLLEAATRLAVRTASARLIVKTVAEGYRIPTFAENVAALETAAAAAASCTRIIGAAEDTGIHAEASALIDAVVNLHADLGTALGIAFRRGYLDVPYCLHPDNAGRARSYLDDDGRLQWSSVGSMPIRASVRRTGTTELTAMGLLATLSYIERKFDSAGLEQEYRAIPDDLTGRTTGSNR